MGQSPYQTIPEREYSRTPKLLPYFRVIGESTFDVYEFFQHSRGCALGTFGYYNSPPLHSKIANLCFPVFEQNFVNYTSAKPFLFFFVREVSNSIRVYLRKIVLIERLAHYGVRYPI